MLRPFSPELVMFSDFEFRTSLGTSILPSTPCATGNSRTLCPRSSKRVIKLFVAFLCCHFAHLTFLLVKGFLSHTESDLFLFILIKNIIDRFFHTLIHLLTYILYSSKCTVFGVAENDIAGIWSTVLPLPRVRRRLSHVSSDVLPRKIHFSCKHQLIPTDLPLQGV